jgi:hypothetical protein
MRCFYFLHSILYYLSEISNLILVHTNYHSLSRCVSVTTNISKSFKEVSRNSILFLILRILILHNEIHLSVWLSYLNIFRTNLRCSLFFVRLPLLQGLNPNVNALFLLFTLHFILLVGNIELFGYQGVFQLQLIYRNHSKRFQGTPFYF